MPQIIPFRRLFPWPWAFKATAALGLSLATAACSLTPSYHRPVVVTAPTWIGRPKTSANAVPATGAWWQSFHSAELDRLMQQSLAGNFNLKAAEARVAEAAGTAQIDGAPLFPQLSLGVTQSQTMGVKNSSTQQAVGQASYELDFWGKNRAAAQSGRALAQASVFDAQTVAMTLSGSVADTYFLVLSLNERIRLAQQIVADAQHVLALVVVQQSAGTATMLQVQQQRNAVATFQAAIPVLQQQSDQAQHLLAVLIGRAPEGFAAGGQDLANLADPAVQPDLPSALLAQRPDIRAAEARLRSANFDIGVARAAFFPSVSLTGAVGFGARHLSDFFPPAAVTDLGTSILQPLFSGGQLQGQLRYSRARQVEMVATYRQTVISAFQDVEDQLSALRHLRDQESIEVTAEAAASQAYALAELQYRLGAADYLTVLTTEESLYQAQDSLLQLRLQRFQATVGLFRALGGGFAAPVTASQAGG